MATNEMITNPFIQPSFIYTFHHLRTVTIKNILAKSTKTNDTICPYVLIIINRIVLNYNLCCPLYGNSASQYKRHIYRDSVSLLSKIIKTNNPSTGSSHRRPASTRCGICGYWPLTVMLMNGRAVVTLWYIMV